jgi:hypothetical protein
MESQAIFLNQFTVCSSCKLKSVVCPFVYEETYGSYPSANGLNRLNEINRLYRLAHLWYYAFTVIIEFWTSFLFIMHQYYWHYDYYSLIGETQRIK